MSLKCTGTLDQKNIAFSPASAHTHISSKVGRRPNQQPKVAEKKKSSNSRCCRRRRPSERWPDLAPGLSVPPPSLSLLEEEEEAFAWRKKEKESAGWRRKVGVVGGEVATMDQRGQLPKKDCRPKSSHPGRERRPIMAG